jgi:hypothetical protein
VLLSDFEILFLGMLLPITLDLPSFQIVPQYLLRVGSIKPISRLGNCKNIYPTGVDGPYGIKSIELGPNFCEFLNSDLLIH